jgi:hypothetical protein
MSIETLNGLELIDGFSTLVLDPVAGPIGGEDVWTIVKPTYQLNATRAELAQLRYAIGRALESGDSDVEGGLDGCTMIVRVREA